MQKLLKTDIKGTMLPTPDLQAATAAANAYARDNQTDLFLLNGGLDYSLRKEVMSLISERRRLEKVCVFLVTEGGDAHDAYRIARCFQRCYSEFQIAVSGWCKSAGTLICIGANSLLIGDNGELGPLDVQLAKPDDLGGRSSGLAIESAFKSLQSTGSYLFQKFLFDIILKTNNRMTTKTAAELSVSLVNGLLSPIFEQMDPLKIGEDFRSTQIVEEYAARLNAKGSNLIINKDFNAATAIVRAYPSHGFVIDREEAQSLFRNVSDIPSELRDVATHLGPFALLPRSLARDEQAIVRYLNDYESGNHGATETQPPETSETVGIAKRSRAQSKSAAGTVSSNSKKSRR